MTSGIEEIVGLLKQYNDSSESYVYIQLFADGSSNLMPWGEKDEIASWQSLEEAICGLKALIRGEREKRHGSANGIAYK